MQKSERHLYGTTFNNEAVQLSSDYNLKFAARSVMGQFSHAAFYLHLRVV